MSHKKKPSLAAKAGAPSQPSAAPAARGRLIPPGAFAAWDGDVLVLNILGKPGAPRDAIGQPLGGELRVSVSAAPEDGRATDVMLRFLASQFGVTHRAVELVFGRTSVHKQVRIHSPRTLPEVIQAAAPRPHSSPDLRLPP